jgi:hypothetical protein
MKFMPIESRPFVTLTGWEQDADADFFGDLRDAVVRVRYRATEEQARRIDHRKIEAALLDAGAWKVHSIQPEIVRAERARVAGIDEQMGPMEALGLYIESNVERLPMHEAMRERTTRYLEAVR